uniref:Apple domain-containing protein n=1 Tax=Heterorhabditis bacteriophora TaxID=37862 RepID=A0A1I7WJI8_HETBA
MMFSALAASDSCDECRNYSTIDQCRIYESQINYCSTLPKGRTK